MTTTSDDKNIAYYLDLEWDDPPLLEPLLDLDLEREALFPDPESLLERDLLLDLDLDREPLFDPDRDPLLDLDRDPLFDLD
jgi:hypothetical protein